MSTATLRYSGPLTETALLGNVAYRDLPEQMAEVTALMTTSRRRSR